MESSRLYTSLANLGSTPAIISPNGSSTYNELNHEWKHWKTRLQNIGIHSGSVVALEADYNTAAVAALLTKYLLTSMTRCERAEPLAWCYLAQEQLETVRAQC